MYVVITCPHCGDTFDIPQERVHISKATKCKAHLESCTEAKSAGVDVAPVAKRKRTDADTSAHEEEIATLRESVTTLQPIADRSETLAERNDELKGRVQDLATQTSDLRAEIQRMREDLNTLRPLVPLVQRISDELGLQSTIPPAPPIDTYVTSLTRLKKAALEPKGSVTSSKDKKRMEALERRNAELEHENRLLRKTQREADERKHYWHLFDPMLNDKANSIAYLRKTSVHTHPDKNPEYRVAAQVHQQVINYWLKELRDA